MTIFQQMLDCDGNQINLFTTQFYNIQNGGSESMYLALKNDGLKVGSKSDASTQNNWYFEATSDGKYYYLKSQDYSEYFTKEAYYLNYQDMPIVDVDPVDYMVELTDITGDGFYWCVKKSGSGFNIVNKNSVTRLEKECNYMNYANNGQGAIITYPQSGDIWIFKSVDYAVSANVQNI